MKKLSLFFGLALIVSALLNAQASAKDITIFDTMVSGSDTGANWYNRGTSPGEDQEVEPGCTTGKAWDLEGFAIKEGKLYTIGSFNFISGQDTYSSGDIFISTQGKPVFGTAASGTGGNDGITQNLFGYNYVLKMDYTNKQFDVYALTTASLVKVHFSQNDGSNPFTYSSGGTKINSDPIGFSYFTGQSDAQILTDYEVTATDGPHNVICTDLSFMPDTGDTWFHLTQECGNDNLMGHSAPLPGAILLLGAGLVRLVAYARRRREEQA